MPLGVFPYNYKEVVGSNSESISPNSGEISITKEYRGPYEFRHAFIHRVLFPANHLRNEYPYWALVLSNVGVVGDRKATFNPITDAIQYDDAVITANYVAKPSELESLYTESGDYKYEIVELPMEATEQSNLSGDVSGEVIITSATTNLTFHDSYFTITLTLPRQVNPNWTIIERTTGAVNDSTIVFPSGIIALPGHCLFEGVSYSRQTNTASFFNLSPYFVNDAYNMTYTFTIRTDLRFTDVAKVIRKDEIKNADDVMAQNLRWLNIITKDSEGNMGEVTAGVGRMEANVTAFNKMDLPDIFAGEYYGLIRNLTEADVADRKSNFHAFTRLYHMRNEMLPFFTTREEHAYGEEPTLKFHYQPARPKIKIKGLNYLRSTTLGEVPISRSLYNTLNAQWQANQGTEGVAPGLNFTALGGN